MTHRASASLPEDPPQSARSRYPGTRPFTDSPDDCARFFGRTEESEQLYLRVLSVPLFVHFGRSGLGKTSLLQAGLFPLLRQRPFLPVMVRLNRSEDALSFAVARSIEQAARAEGLAPNVGRPEGLWELLSTTTVWRDDLLLTPVLVFDQFEEVFTLRNAAFRAELATGLGSFASGIAPERLHAGRSDGRERLATRPHVKVLISLREDYLGSLQEFSAALPDLFHERLRLEPLTEEAARRAVTEPAQLMAGVGEEPYWAPRFDFDRPALDSMIEYLKGKSGLIEPFQLQLLCRHAEAIARRKGGTQDDAVTLTTSDFTGGEGFDSVLRDFYENTLLKVGGSQRRKARKLCEEDLLDASGHRLMREEGQIHGAGITNETLTRLSEERLVRRERRLESVFYEISHDRLAESIFASRPSRLPKTVRRAVWTGVIVTPLVLLGVIAWALLLRNARVKSERSVSFLLGERFLGEVRDLGRSTMLEQVDRHVGTGDQWAALNYALALRNRGDIKRVQGLLGESVGLFEEALGVLESIPGDPASTREAARTRERLGEAVADQGLVTRALSHYEAAVKAWREVATSPGDPPQATDDCTSLADSLVSVGQLKDRMGETTDALRVLEEALQVSSTVLFGRKASRDECGPAAGTPETYPHARALEVFSRVVLLRASLLNFMEDYEGAAALAIKAAWLRPPSISARRNSLAGVAFRGNARRWETPQRALDDYRTVLDAFEDLQRWDPSNQLWQRERAATQLLVSEGIVACRDRRIKHCDPRPSIEQAEAVTLEAIATLRELAQIDQTNVSLRKDLGWALLCHARVLAARDLHTERLAALEESESFYATPRLDSADTDAEALLANLLLEKSRALAALNQPQQAEDTLQKSIDRLKGLIRTHPNAPNYVQYLIAARMREAEVRREAGDRVAAAAAGGEVTELKALHKTLIRAVPESSDTHAEEVGEGARLFRGGDYAGALREFNTAESSLREWIGHRPTAVSGYNELRNIYDWIQLTHERLGNAEERTAPLVASMHAAQVAAWLASKDAQTKMNKLLLASRDKLVLFLYHNERLEEALPMVQEEIRVAQTLAQGAPHDAAYMRGLGVAKCGLGVVRRDLKKAGWEEAIRSGLIDIQKGAQMDTKRGDFAKELGAWRKYLADQLDADGGREENAEREYELSLEAYQEAARRVPGDEEVEKAIRELVERGIQSRTSLHASSRSIDK